MIRVISSTDVDITAFVEAQELTLYLLNCGIPSEKYITITNLHQ